MGFYWGKCCKNIYHSTIESAKNILDKEWKFLYIIFDDWHERDKVIKKKRRLELSPLVAAKRIIRSKQD